MRIAIATVVLFSIVTSSASAQMWGDAEYLYFGRLSGSSTPIVGGPGGFSSVDNSGAASGYRLTIGGFIGQLEVEASLMNVEGLSDSSAGTLTSALALDNQANNAVVFGAVPVNSFVIPSGLSLAANAGVESLEAEFLLPGATYALESFTDLRSGEINFGTNRTLNPWRLAIGYRTFLIKDGSSSLINGNFDALDVDDAQTVGGGANDPNDGLSHAALIAAGYTTAFGAADGFDNQASAGGPDTLAIYSAGTARNELHGAQITGGYQLFPLDWMTVELIGKAGLFYNNVQGSIVEALAGGGNDDSVYQRTLSGKKSSAAFAGTLGAKGMVPITDYISFSFGYEIMFFSGLGLGSRQFDGVTTNLAGQHVYSPRSSSHLIVHGGNVGLQLTW